jgi:hypothetical protein
MCLSSQHFTFFEQVIRGWEVALKSMAKGEVAEVYVRQDWSYATDGMRLKGLLPYTAINHALAVPAGSTNHHRHDTIAYSQESMPSSKARMLITRPRS